MGRLRFPLVNVKDSYVKLNFVREIGVSPDALISEDEIEIRK